MLDCYVWLLNCISVKWFCNKKDSKLGNILQKQHPNPWFHYASCRNTTRHGICDIDRNLHEATYNSPCLYHQNNILQGCCPVLSKSRSMILAMALASSWISNDYSINWTLFHYYPLIPAYIILYPLYIPDIPWTFVLTTSFVKYWHIRFARNIDT